MADWTEKLARVGIVPVLVLEDPRDALPLGESLLRGGLSCAEVTFRTPAAAEALKQLAGAFPDMLLGAGTVLDREQADRALDAGAAFIVSPGLNPAVTRYVTEKGIPMIPGVCTPTEIEAAMGLGLKTLKFFPAEAAGGVSMIRALAAPYRGIRFMPTGGINENNVADYLRLDAVVACGGSWMVRPDLIREGRFGEIESLTRRAAQTVREIRGEKES